MPQSVYLRPTGLLHGTEAARAVAQGIAARLAGGPSAFTAVECIERESSGSIRRGRFLPVPELASSAETALQAQFAALTAARPPICGFDFSRPVVMGIVNVTPDSFSDGGLFAEAAAAISHGRELAAAGADILDIGGESTRPGADDVSDEDEAARVIPVIEDLRELNVPISVDTRKAVIMQRALAAGAQLVNDVSALSHDPQAIDLVADTGVPVVLMHAKGDPKTMQVDPRYDDVAVEVFDMLAERIQTAETAGIPRRAIIADPGLGFGKTYDHNVQLLRELSLFHGLGVPLLLGASRKAFIGRMIGEPEAGKRVIGSLAAAMAGLAQGVQMVRVHDVRETVQSVAVWHNLYSC